MSLGVKRRRAAEQTPGASILTAAAVVYSARSELAGLTHVAQSISDFVDSASERWTLENAMDMKAVAAAPLEEASAVRLLDHLLTREWSGLSDAFRMERFLFNVKQAGQSDKMQIVDWWLTKYLPLNEATAKNIMQGAIDWNRIHVLELLEQKGILHKPKERLATECRHADTVYWLHERDFFLSIDVEIEIGRNNMEFIKWLNAHKESHIIRDLEKAMVIAASVNSVEMLQYLGETFYEPDWDEPDDSKTYDLELKTVTWLEEKFGWNECAGSEFMNEFMDDDYGGDSDSEGSRDSMDEDEDNAHQRWVNHTMTVAAKRGQLDIVKYLYNNKQHQPSCKLMFSAAEHGHMETVQWLHEMEPACAESAIGFAAKGGHFEIVKWLHQHTGSNDQGKSKKQWLHEHGSKRSIDKAAESGSLEIVQWLHEHRPDECSTVAMNKAAEKGHLEVLKWLHGNRSEGCTGDALFCAACDGHLAIVQWLFEHRKECLNLETMAMETAALQGHFDMVKWLHENNPPESGSAEAVDGAVEAGHFEVVKYLLENTSAGCTKDAVLGSATYGYPKILKFIIESGFASFPDPMTESIAMRNHYDYDSDDDFEFDDEGFSVDPMTAAAENGHVQIVKYLYERSRLRCNVAAIKQAGDRMQFAVVEWVMQHDPNFANYKFKPLRLFKRRKRETLCYLKHSI